MRVELVPPATEPVSVAEFKAYLRVEGSDEDALIAGLGRSATAMCEAFTGLTLIVRPLVEVIDADGDGRRLTRAPVVVVDGVDALDAGGVVRALAADVFTTTIDANGVGRVRTGDGSAERLSVRYRAGMADNWNGVPEPLRQGITRLVAHLYAERDATAEQGPPAAVTALWRPYRQLKLS